MTDKKHQYVITQTWDGRDPEDGARVTVALSSTKTEKRADGVEGLIISVEAPFYNDPKVPEDIPKGSMNNLWDYEVVEVFFLGSDAKTYLEIELSPSGHYLLLKLEGPRNIVQSELPLSWYKTSVTHPSNNNNNSNSTRWIGEAVIPFTYFPSNPSKFNAYSIHKSDPNRVYMALFPTPKNKYDHPDFHRLDYFQHINLSGLLP